MLAGRYMIQKKLGEGGMGAVYLATHNVLEKQVALKVLHGEFARKPDLVERFMQEAKSASRIRHENVIDISDFGTTPEGLVFFAMELLKGHDLHEEIARARLAGQLLPWSRTQEDLPADLRGARRRRTRKGIVHRDLKPENIYLVDFLGEPDFVKLLDFGIAKLTEVDEGDRKLTQDRHAVRHARVHVARAGARRERRSPRRRLRDGLHPVPARHRPRAVRGRQLHGRAVSLHLTEPPPSIAPEVFDQIGAPRALAGVIDRRSTRIATQRWQTIDELANAVRDVCGDPIPTGDDADRAPRTCASPSQTTHAPRADADRSACRSQTVTPEGTGRVKTQWTGNLQRSARSAVEAAEAEVEAAADHRRGRRRSARCARPRSSRSASKHGAGARRRSTRARPSRSATAAAAASRRRSRRRSRCCPRW